MISRLGNPALQSLVASNAGAMNASSAVNASMMPKEGVANASLLPGDANADAAAKAAHAANASKEAGKSPVSKVAKDFESIFLRQILTTAKIGGSEKGGGYGGMAVDALADSISKGGGLGLARQIEQALAAHQATGSKMTEEKTQGAAHPAVSKSEQQEGTKR